MQLTRWQSRERLGWHTLIIILYLHIYVFFYLCSGFKGLVNLQNIFETLHDLNASDEKTKMLKPPS